MSAATSVDAALLRGMPLPKHDGGGSKDARGSVLVAGGSEEVPGAVLLSGTAALRAGAGRLRLAICDSMAPALAVAMPEARVIGLPRTPEGGIAAAAAAPLLHYGSQAKALVLGPGMSGGQEAEALVAALLQELSGPALVLDAAALAPLAGCREALRRHAGRAVITPHDGEMARLLGISREEVLADPLGMARRAAALLQVVVIMKGACSRIVTPEGDAWASDHGNIGLATSGSGDVLSGIIAGLLARGATPLQAAIWGVWVHGEAGHRLARAQGPVGYLARELPAEVPRILADLAA